MALLQDLLVHLEFLLPNQTKPTTTFTLNPIFPLRTSLGQLCNRFGIDSKRARLWKIVKGGQDELLDLEKVRALHQISSAV